jgi:hypothetical protein
LRAFPAAVRAGAIGLAATALTWIGVRIWHHDSRPRIFLLGDSFIGNYRYAPGTRLEDDLARLEPDCRIDNWAQSGAEPLDFLLQMYRGRMLAGKPRTVIIALSADKFLAHERRPRTCARGVNLGWLPWDRVGWRLVRSMPAREQGIALAQKAALCFFGMADAINAVWRERVGWNHDRRRMCQAPGSRHRQILERAKEKLAYLDSMKVPSQQAYGGLPFARDAAFMLHGLREEGIDARVVLLPWGNPEVYARVCTARALVARDSVTERMRAWLRDQNVPVLDLTSPAELAHFPGRAWDDANHPKDASVFEYMSHRIAETWPRPGEGPSGAVAAFEPDDEEPANGAWETGGTDGT